MKRKLFIGGLVAVLLMSTLLMYGCDDGGGAGSGYGSGTVIVQNRSASTFDARVYVDISYTYNVNNVLGYRYINRNQQVTFTNVPTGESLQVWVIDGLDIKWYSSSFTLSRGQTIQFVYDGYSIVRR